MKHAGGLGQTAQKNGRIETVISEHLNALVLILISMLVFRSEMLIIFIFLWFLTSVTASNDAECLRRKSITRKWFFLQAICKGVKPFC